MSKSSFVRRGCVAGVAGLATGVLVGTPANAAGSTYPYTFNEHNQTQSFTDTGLCDPTRVLITLSSYNEVLHVNATVPGLTQVQAEALLENDPAGVITKASYTQEGSFTVPEASGITYTGHFSSWFGASISLHTTVFSGVFHVNGTGTDGSRVSGEFTSHLTLVNGQEVVSFDKGHLTGCP